MNLHSRRFERRLRPAVRRAIRASKALRKEFRRRRVPRLRRINARPMLWVFLAFFYVVARAGSDYDPGFSTAAVTVLVFFVCGRVFSQATQLVQSLFASPELGVAYHLPVYEPDFFRMQFRRFLLQSLGILAAFGAVYLGRQAEYNAPNIPLTAGVAAALLGWLLYVALCLLAVRYGLRFGVMPGYAFYTVAAFLFFAEFSASRPVPVAYFAALVLPAGWGEAAYYRFAEGNLPFALATLLAIGLLVELSRRNYLWLRAMFLQALIQPRLAHPSVATPEADTEAGVAPVSQQTETQGGQDWTDWARAQQKLLAAKASDHLHQGALQVVLNWDAAGPIEAIVGKWLTDRERTVAEFLLGEQVGWWTERWKRSAYICLGVLAGSLLPVIPVWALVLAGFVALFTGAPATGGQWLGFTHMWAGVLKVPMLAVFPVGYREVSRAMIKINVLRLLAWAPLGILMGIAVGWRIDDAGRGAVFALASLFVLLASQPFLVVAQFSQGTSTGKRSLKAFVSASGGAFLALLFLVAALVFWFLLILAEWRLREWIWMGGLLAIPFSVLLWWWFGVVFNRGWVDHVAPQQKQIGQS